MGAGPTLLQRTWDMLDREVDAIKDPATNNRQYHIDRAGAIAEVLAMFMVPHFTSREAISREALTRWNARQADDDTYETKGLGSRAYEMPPPTREIPKATTKKSATKKAAAPRSSGNRIPDEAVNNVLNGITTQMFTVDQIATMYKMTASEVRSQLGIA